MDGFNELGVQNNLASWSREMLTKITCYLTWGDTQVCNVHTCATTEMQKRVVILEWTLKKCHTPQSLFAYTSRMIYALLMH